MLKNSMTEITAEEMNEVISPTIRTTSLLDIFVEIYSKIKMIGNAPRNEDSAIHSWRDNPAEATIVGVAPIISRHTATPRLAPELMPNTEGSASGLLNNVCNKRPETDRSVSSSL